MAITNQITCLPGNKFEWCFEISRSLTAINKCEWQSNVFNIGCDPCNGTESHKWFMKFKFDHFSGLYCAHVLWADAADKANDQPKKLMKLKLHAKMNYRDYEWGRKCTKCCTSKLLEGPNYEFKVNFYDFDMQEALTRPEDARFDSTKYVLTVTCQVREYALDSYEFCTESD